MSSTTSGAAASGAAAAPSQAASSSSYETSEQATADRVGSAANCVSGPQGDSGVPPPHGGGKSPPGFVQRILGLTHPTTSPSSATSSPRQVPRASMPSPRLGGHHHGRRESVIEDNGGLEYPLADEELAELRAKRHQRNPSYAHIFPQDQWPGYRPIEEHGLIGNMHTCALVSTDAQVSWYWSVQTNQEQESTRGAIRSV